MRPGLDLVVPPPLAERLRLGLPVARLRFFDARTELVLVS